MKPFIVLMSFLMAFLFVGVGPGPVERLVPGIPSIYADDDDDDDDDDEGRLVRRIQALEQELAALTSVVSDLVNSAVTGNGTDSFIPRWDDPNTLENSVIFQNDAGKVGIGTIDPEKELHVVGDMKVTGKIFVGDATIEITDDRIKFPDGTEQITAFLDGAGGGVSESSDPDWTGTHTWQTDTGPGSGKTLETFSTTTVTNDSEVTLISIPVPDDSMLFLNIWVGQVSADSLVDSGFARYLGLAQKVGGVGGVGGTVTVGLGFEDLTNDEAGDRGIDVDFVPNNASDPKVVDVKVTNARLSFNYTGWIEYTSVSIPPP